MKIPALSRSHTFACILLFGLLALTARNAIDPDLWWHLRTGQWIMETGHIPHFDSFSFTRAGSPWVAHEWLSAVAFYEIRKLCGEGGLIVFSALVTTAGFMLLFLRSGGKPPWTAAAVTLGALAAAPTWGVRPQMFTFTLASLLLWLLDRSEQAPRLLFWIPPLFLLWLNLHAGFAFGLALLVAVMGGLILETIVGETPWTDTRIQLGRLLLTLCACIALVPINPNGTQLYRYPLDVLSSAGMRSFISEWFPPDFHQLRYLSSFLIWVSLLWALSGSRTRPKARVLIPLLMMFLAALDAGRHIALFVLLSIPIIAAALAGMSPLKVTAWTQSGVSSDRPRFAFRTAVLLLMAGFAATRWIGLTHKQATSEAALFPAKASVFLRSQPTPGRLFVYYDWGGYAIWKLYPQYRVFIDGRADLYGDELIHQYQQAAGLRAGWRDVLDQAGVDSILIPPASALAQGLQLDGQWQETYRDSQAVFFRRRPSPIASLDKSGNQPE